MSHNLTGFIQLWRSTCLQGIVTPCSDSVCRTLLGGKTIRCFESTCPPNLYIVELQFNYFDRVQPTDVDSNDAASLFATVALHFDVIHSSGTNRTANADSTDSALPVLSTGPACKSQPRAGPWLTLRDRNKHIPLWTLKNYSLWTAIFYHMQEQLVIGEI